MGTITALTPRGGDMRLAIATGKLDMAGVGLGDSIAVSGVCLTVVAFDANSFTADVSGETLRCTTLGKCEPGARVNLEKALTLATPLGGHLVSGHVDGVGKVLERREDARSVFFSIEVPVNLAHYIARKGSVCVDGVSLTVNAVGDNHFTLNIVPHTLAETTLDEFVVGRQANIEVDIIARYLERLLEGKPDGARATDGVTAELLQRSGFIKP